MSKIIAVIHARGGSKRIPLKNIKPLNGVPLVAYMIKAALGSKHLERVIVSTDHLEIKRIALEYGAEVPFMRPAEISEDVGSELVTQHAVKFVEEEEKELVELAVTLQPTVPFCTPQDIDACIEKVLNDKDFTSSFSIRGISERPEWMFYIDGKYVKSTNNVTVTGDLGVSQTFRKLYYPSGAVYVTRRDTLFNENVLISARCAPHIMSRESSLDIDEPIDFQFCEFLAREHFNVK